MIISFCFLAAGMDTAAAAIKRERAGSLPVALYWYLKVLLLRWPVVSGSLQSFVPVRYSHLKDSSSFSITGFASSVHAKHDFPDGSSEYSFRKDYNTLSIK
jgi:hypothetical protein